jgi:hypothetical protein
MVLNTSFNENEPVVCEPRQALDCFLRTRMDMLVMGNAVLQCEVSCRFVWDDQRITSGQAGYMAAPERFAAMSEFFSCTAGS